MKVFLRIVFVLLLLALAGAGWLYYQYKDVLLPLDMTGKGEPKVVEVASGSTAGDIGAQLEKEGLIRSAQAFKYLVRHSNKSDSLQSGFYSISPSQSPEEIIEQLCQGRVLSRKVTIPEGLLIPQVGKILADKKICSAEEFVELASKHGKDYGNYPDNLLGYLLPDTYEIPWVCTADDMVRTMTERFEELARPQVDGTSPLDMPQTLVLASLIEREARVASERPVIAGVYINRLKIGMLLQCDASIQFALGKQKPVLLYSDLEIDSPYNTYKHAGLPPGPICNPGIAAIKAAAHPQKNDYLFYVLNEVKGDGSHVFTSNEADHARAVNKYLR